MAIYALADLHLCLSNPDKSMAICWGSWADYVEKIKENWENTVTAEDTVLVSGDISWATYIAGFKIDIKKESDESVEATKTLIDDFTVVDDENGKEG